MSKTRVCFMGTPEFAQTVLKALIDCPDYEVIMCCCQPDKPVGRKKIITPPPSKVLAVENNIEVFQPDSMKTDGSYETIKAASPDLIVTAAYGKILPQRILDIPSKGSVNVHASLLPKYRGSAPVQFAIMDGESETGVTIMKMDAGIDTGDMISVVKVPIDENIDTEGLMAQLAEAGGKLLIETLPGYLDGSIKSVPQDNDKATLCSMIKPEDGIIDWKDTARKIHDRVRALTAWPGASTLLDGNKLKIYKTRLVSFDGDASQYKEGAIVVAHKKDLIVKCGEGFVAIDELQTSGGKRLMAIDCAHNFKVGTVLGE